MTDQSPQTIWELSEVSLATEAHPRLRDVTLAITPGVTAIIGPSGAGKTTLLNLLVGFETPTMGRISQGNDWPAISEDTPPVFWVPQDDGLWPHMTAAQHIAAVAPQSDDSKHSAILASLSLEGCAGRKPDQLSQGERSRLAVARAMATEAPILVMDEPLVHVDPGRSASYWQIVRNYIRKSNRSLVFATHSPQRVLAEADHVICMEAGRVVYSGPVAELYWNPPGEKLGRFLGDGNWFTPEDLQTWFEPDIAARIQTRLAAKSNQPKHDVVLDNKEAGVSSSHRADRVSAEPTLAADVSDSGLPGVSLPVDRTGVMIRPEQMDVHIAEAGPILVESSLFQGVVSEVTLRHEPTGATRRVYHRPTGPAIAPGARVLLRAFACILAIMLPILASGCDSRAAADSVLPVKEIEHWPMPAKGARVPAPRSIDAGPDNRVYALDTAGRVLIFSAEGKPQRIWEMPAYDAGRPEGITRLSDGRIAVTDTHYSRIIYFDDQGNILKMFGTPGHGNGEFIYPVGITEDDKGFIYVCEYGGNDRVQKFTLEGEFVQTFGENGTLPGEFQRPSGIEWHDGRLYVADAINNRVQVFTDDGEFIGILNEMGEAPVTLQFPYDVRVSPDGNLYIVEYRAGRVTKLDADGNILGRFGSSGIDVGKFVTPWGLAVNQSGRVLVADTGNHRIVELQF